MKEFVKDDFGNSYIVERDFPSDLKVNYNPSYDENTVTVYAGESISNDNFRNHKLNHIRVEFPYLLDQVNSNKIVNKCINDYVQSGMTSDQLIKNIILGLCGVKNE